MEQNGKDFLKSFAWAFGGALLGSMLDNTRFGHWFNTSEFIGFIFGLIKAGILALAIYYIYCVIQVW